MPDAQRALIGERSAEAVGEVAAEADWLHVDVMDGHFVPNLTIGPPVVQSLRKHSGLFFDCHLMMTNPGDFLESFRRALGLNPELEGIRANVQHLERAQKRKP